MSLRRFLATSDAALPRFARTARRQLHSISLPVPIALVRPLVFGAAGVRMAWDWIFRIFICEPHFKAHCRRLGSGLRTGVHLAWVQGGGDILVGDGVHIHGKLDIGFAARFAERPRLIIGDGTSIGHGVNIVVAKEVQIGRFCHIAADTRILDSPGHPLDPALRRMGQPPDQTEVKPVHIGDNVWLGAGVVVLPGVRIGDNSVVATRSVVATNVPPNTLVAGYPARPIKALGIAASKPPSPSPTLMRGHDDQHAHTDTAAGF